MVRLIVQEKIRKLGIGMRINKIPPACHARPLSLNGIVPFSKGGRRVQRADGFTLIEVLVVLIIVAIITAVAVMAFGQFGRGRREKIIADQFVRVISVAQLQAILTPEILGLGVTPSGYRFYEYTVTVDSKKGEWKSLHSDALSRPNVFKKVFDADIKSITGFESDKSENNRAQPQILFLPSGFVTPFVLELNGTENHFLITVKNNGVVSVSGGEDANKH